MARRTDRLIAVVEAVGYDGVAVEHEQGWRSRGGRRFDPKGFTVHHDASPRGSDIRHIIRDGHASLSGPLANLYLTRDGTLVVIAAGRANHAGRGGWKGLRGNSSVWGLEIANDGTGEPYTTEQLRVVRLLMRAFVEVDGVPVDLVHSHHEWRSEKPDPAVDPRTRAGPWHMDRFRADIEEDGMQTLRRGDSGNVVHWWQWRINEYLHGDRDIGVTVDGAYGPETERAVRELQDRFGFPETGELDGHTQMRLLYQSVR